MVDNIKIAIITDSTCTLDEQYKEEKSIYSVPLNIIVGDKQYRESIDLTNEKIYSILRSSNEDISTSQPAVGEFVELYEELKKDYDFAFAIHASGSLTGTLNTSVLAAEQVGFKIYAIDSRTGSYPLNVLVKKLTSFVELNKTPETIIEEMNELIGFTNLYFVPDNLKQLHKSGRVSGSSYLISSALSIKPILYLEDGEVKVDKKVRTKKKAYKHLVEMLLEKNNQSPIKELAVLHADNTGGAEELSMLIKAALPNIKIVSELFIPVVGVHTGAGTLGVAWVDKK